MWIATILTRFRRLRKLSRMTGISWPVLVELGLLARGRWRALSRRDRARLAVLLRRSRGWPGNLSVLERAELWALIVRMDLRTLAGDATAAWHRGRHGGDPRWRDRAAFAARVSRTGFALRNSRQATRRPVAWRARRG